MATGQVKSFNKKKGYGFIVVDGEDEMEIFVHYSDIEGGGYRLLLPDEPVEFEIVETNKGLKAVNVRRI